MYDKGKGLYKSIYGATGVGIFDQFYSQHGAPQAVKSFESRLGQTDETTIFNQNLLGFPVWFVGSLALIYALANYK